MVPSAKTVKTISLMVVERKSFFSHAIHGEAQKRANAFPTFIGRLIRFVSVETGMNSLLYGGDTKYITSA